MSGLLNELFLFVSVCWFLGYIYGIDKQLKRVANSLEKIADKQGSQGS